MTAEENSSRGARGDVKAAAFVRAYLTTMRPYLLPVSGLAGAAGISLAGAQGAWRTAAAMLPFYLLYGFGQALTDCFQQDTDRLSAPYRPLVAGRISRRAVLAVSLAGLLGGAAVLAILNPWDLLLSLAGIVGLAVYTPLKRMWWAGPLANAWVVALLPIMGWLTAPDGTPLELASHPAVLAAALANLLAYANFVLVGYLKDVGADRQSGYRTFPVRFGWKRTALCSHAWALAALGAAAWAVLLAGGTGGQSLIGWVPLALAAGVSVAAQARAQGVDSEDKAHGPIAGTVRVFLLINAAIVMAARPAWWPIAAGTCAAFEALLRMRPDRHQI